MFLKVFLHSIFEDLLSYQNRSQNILLLSINENGEQYLFIPLLELLQSESTTKGTSSGQQNGLPKMTILWYSQTGTAEDFAHRLCDEAKQFGFVSEAFDVQDYEKVLSPFHSLCSFCSFILYVFFYEPKRKRERQNSVTHEFPFLLTTGRARGGTTSCFLCSNLRRR